MAETHSTIPLPSISRGAAILDLPTEPLISEANASIERTHRATGMPREEIFRRGLVRAEIPMFGIGGIVTSRNLLNDSEDAAIVCVPCDSVTFATAGVTTGA